MGAVYDLQAKIADLKAEEERLNKLLLDLIPSEIRPEMRMKFADPVGLNWKFLDTLFKHGGSTTALFIEEHVPLKDGFDQLATAWADLIKVEANYGESSGDNAYSIIIVTFSAT